MKERLRPREIMKIWGLTRGQWQHYRDRMDLKPVRVRGFKPWYRSAVVVEKFGRPDGAA